MITCYDTAFNGEFPPGAAAYAAYIDGAIGSQPNYAYIVATFPDARHLSIALFPEDDADALDVEPGAAVPPDIPAWHARQAARGVARPAVYASTSTMEAEVLPVLALAGIARESVRLWTAHYGLGEHICGPSSCGALSVDADGTQWCENAMGRTLDQSLLLDSFFGTPAPSPNWQEAMLQALPVVQQGATGAVVRTVQGLLCARGYTVVIDGDYGPATTKGVEDLQRAAGLSVDGVVGEQTYPALLGIA